MAMLIKNFWVVDEEEEAVHALGLEVWLSTSLFDYSWEKDRWEGADRERILR